ncbi:hypothetical protein [Streptomyces sp. TRM64462]|uniref:hypothetical protein n=1 Tax=Streptomyces sp. TRM64462 TaxID=2741726 RepID=UPI00158681A1|nr:hypothetical protein [Streptomyces sp. TRM64462]
MSAAEHETTALPQPHTLTEMQRYGLHCVHCGGQMAPGGAVELGTQHNDDPILGRVAWYPRACTGCTARGQA